MSKSTLSCLLFRLAVLRPAAVHDDTGWTADKHYAFIAGNPSTNPLVAKPATGVRPSGPKAPKLALTLVLMNTVMCSVVLPAWCAHTEPRLRPAEVLGQSGAGESGVMRCRVHRQLEAAPQEATAQPAPHLILSRCAASALMQLLLVVFQKPWHAFGRAPVPVATRSLHAGGMLVQPWASAPQVCSNVHFLKAVSAAYGLVCALV